MGNNKIYEFCARKAGNHSMLYDNRITACLALELSDLKTNTLFTITINHQMWSDHCKIGVITPISQNVDIVLGRETYWYRLELDDSTPMGKFASQILDKILDSPISKSKDVSKYLTVALNPNPHEYCKTDSCILVINFNGMIDASILEDYYEIVYTKEYNKRFKFE